MRGVVLLFALMIGRFGVLQLCVVRLAVVEIGRFAGLCVIRGNC